MLKNTTSIFIECLEEWGVPRKIISVKNRNSNYFNKSTINGKKDGAFFRIIIYAQFNTINNNELKWIWDFNLIFFPENPNEINLSITSETLGNKLGKLFGKWDLEIYEDSFDKAFYIQSNHKYAHVETLDQSIQKKLLRQIIISPTFIIKGKQIRCKINFNPYDLQGHKTNILDLLDIGFELSKNIDNWQPPKP